MKSRYIIRLITLLLCYVFILTSCNDEWKEEQYKQYISFRAPLGELGVTDVYIPYSRRNPDKTFVKGSGLSSAILSRFLMKHVFFSSLNYGILISKIILQFQRILRF